MYCLEEQYFHKVIKEIDKENMQQLLILPSVISDFSVHTCKKKKTKKKPRSLMVNGDHNARGLDSVDGKKMIVVVVF